MSVLGIVPARLSSTRLARKLLRSETGHPLVWHAWQRARMSSALSRLVVATDSVEIAAAVDAFGGDVVMTAEHPTGTERCAEVANRFAEFDTIVNIQGDEPEIDPRDIDSVVAMLNTRDDLDMATLSDQLQRSDESDSSKVKMHWQDGVATAFGRRRLPSWGIGNVGRHIGLYAFRREALLWLAAAPRCWREQKEQLEQLRALHEGFAIGVARARGDRSAGPGIDTESDYQAFVARWSARQEIIACSRW
jgi:3-deoxy-manno-octulosonate cytidylyltransferase (CMP-KDO synthetase)